MLRVSGRFWPNSAAHEFPAILSATDPKRTFSRPVVGCTLMEKTSSTQLSKFNDWLQTIAALAVLVGLILVFQELRQNNVIASAERISSSFQEGSEIRRFMYENETLLLLQKAVEQPNDLSDADLARLDSFFEMMWNYHAQRIVVSELGLINAPLEILAADYAWYCQSSLCRNWMKENQDWLVTTPEFNSAVLLELERLPVPTKFQYLDDLRSTP